MNPPLMLLCFDDLINRIKTNTNGTLIIIQGQVGCGKTTLGIELLKELNGRIDTDMMLLYNTDIPGKRYNAYLLDDLPTPYLIRDISNTIDYVVKRLNKCLILIVPDIRYLPTNYRNDIWWTVDTKDLHIPSECVISFPNLYRNTERGTFTVDWFNKVGDCVDHYKSVGKITKQDVEDVSAIQKEWIDIKIDMIKRKFE